MKGPTSSNVLYQFIWHELCDWYLELVKPYLYPKGDGNRRVITQKILVYVLDKTLKLLHPYMPFITEEVWQRLPHEGESIMVAGYPEVMPELIDEGAVREMERIKEVITGIRNIRGEMGISPKTIVDVILLSEDEHVAYSLKEHLGFIKDLARIRDAKILVEGERPRAAATALADGVEIFVPLQGVVEDPQRELKRLTKELRKLLDELQLTNRKLSNESFLNKAPLNVVNRRLSIIREMVVGGCEIDGLRDTR